MFGKKKESKQLRPVGSLEQYGIFEVPDINIDNINNNMMEDEDNDESLEAELAALTADNDISCKSRPSAAYKIANTNLDEMIADCMKDINSDEELSEKDDDSALLKELQMLTGNETVTEKVDMSELMEEQIVHDENESTETKEENNSMQELIKLLQERLKIYEIAEEKAKRNDETGRIRRYNRGIKTLKQMLVFIQSGRSINEADIPPSLPSSATTESNVQNIEEKTLSLVGINEIVATLNDDNPLKLKTDVTIEQEILDKLKERQQKYKTAAIAWKRTGNKTQALQYVKTIKEFDIIITAVTEGRKFDVLDMPPIPILPSTNIATSATKEENEIQQQASTGKCGSENIEVALKERLEVYRRTKVAAENEGNTSKSRRYGRICKQFEDAIKLYTTGKVVPLDELPVPPGFPSLSLNLQNNIAAQSTSELETSENNTVKKPVQPKIPVPSSKGLKPNQKITSRAEKQTLQLQLRQRDLKQAALNAKKDGDMDLARDYLRQAKGIQPLIEASKAGLPVDMTSIPLSPLEKVELNTLQKDENFILISSEDFLEDLTGTDDKIYENLETQLIKQIKWCLSTRDHSKALGDVSGYNRWERFALSYTRDLDMLRVRKRDSLPPPQHHYETKTYQIVRSYTDLNDSDIEISIIRGINYSQETDTYVICEFPFPLDNHPVDRTSTIKDSANPEYQAVFLLNGIINRTSRQCQRAFKRYSLKCEIWAKGGFFRSDTLLGTVLVKLQPLESQCTLHDSFPLMDGRKATGGKLELKVRLRNPILFKQIENITDKWLTIDQ